MEFKELAEQTVNRMFRQFDACGSDLYVNEKCSKAVIGIQVDYGGMGRDSIFLLTGNGKLETILEKTFRSGRMWPTGISEDGRSISYVIKTEEGERLEKVYRI